MPKGKLKFGGLRSVTNWSRYVKRTALQRRGPLHQPQGLEGLERFLKKALSEAKKAKPESNQPPSKKMTRDRPHKIFTRILVDTTLGLSNARSYLTVNQYNRTFKLLSQYAEVLGYLSQEHQKLTARFGNEDKWPHSKLDKMARRFGNELIPLEQEIRTTCNIETTDGKPLSEHVFKQLETLRAIARDLA